MKSCLIIICIFALPDFGIAQEQRSKLNGSDLHPLLKRAEQQRIDVIKQASASTVCIYSTDGQGGGSGVIIDPSGFAISNYHVVDPCGYHMHCGLNDGKVYDAVVVGIDPVGDLALIKILGRNDFPAAKMGDSDKAKVADECFAAGNPFLLANDFQPTITWGMISGTNRYQYPSGTLLEYADCLQTDAAINPGNSGGPLFDHRGTLIGINGRGSFEKRGRVNVGVGYAISINQVRNFLGTLKSGRILDHASAGFVVSTAQDQSVRISMISEKSDAYRQGLRYDSEILSVAGRRVKTVNDFKNILGTLPPHWKIPISFVADGNQFEAMIRLQDFHSPADLLEKVSRSDQDLSPQAFPIPKSVKSQFISQRGFANRYFNDLQTKQRIAALRLKYNPKSLNLERLTVLGKSRLDDVKYVFRKGRSGIKIGDESATLESDLPFENQILPANSKGFLNLLHIFHELIFARQHQLGLSYLGTAPFVRDGEVEVSKNWNTRKQCHVLRILRDATEMHLYLSDDSAVVAAEFFAYPGADPCIVEFHGLKSHKQISVPNSIRVRTTGRIYADIKYESLEFEIGSGPENKPRHSAKNSITK